MKRKAERGERAPEMGVASLTGWPGKLLRCEAGLASSAGARLIWLALRVRDWPGQLRGCEAGLARCEAGLARLAGARLGQSCFFFFELEF